MLRRYKTKIVPSLVALSSPAVLSSSLSSSPSANSQSSLLSFSSRSDNGGSNNRSNTGSSNLAVPVNENNNGNSNQQQQQQQQQKPVSQFGNNSFEEQMVALGASIFGQAASAMAQKAGGGGTDMTNPLASMFSSMSKMAEVKQWKCWCGHVFEAPGEWIPCEHALCQAPGCPDRKYFTTGEGAKMLDAGKGGVPLESTPVSDKGNKNK